MKAQSDLIEQGILGIVVGLVVVKVLFGGAAMVAMVHSYIAVTVICAVLFAIAALVFTIHGRWHRWRHPPKPPMTAEERARRRAARPQPSAAEVQRFMADFERMRTERIRASRAT